MASIGRFAAFLSFAAHLHPILGLQSSYASTNRNDSSTDYTVGITSTTDGESSFIGSGTITVTAVVGNDGGIVRVPEGAYTDTDQVEHESWVEKTFDGPATFITTAVFDEYQTEVITFPRFKSSTTTVTVEWGNLAVNMLQDGFMSMSISSGWELWTSIEKFSTTTLAGPTTAILVARAPGTFDQPNYFLADDKNGFCVERLSLTEGPQYRTFRVKSAVGTLTPGETLTTQVRRDLWSSIYGYIPWALISTAFSQPGINYVTYTQTLSATLNREGDARDWIAERCIGRCWSCPDWGSCQDCHVYFESVDVHYWAVESPNTGCLISTSTTMLSHAEKFKRGMRAVVRSISKPVPGISTIVNDEGFTFTSPSIYIAFPTVSAADLCGPIGSVHTSITLAFAPEEISSAVLTYLTNPYTLSTEYHRFNFADALCMPSSLSSRGVWTVIGLDGAYNPIISPPSILTNLDSAWNYKCSAGPFQGNDPPIALNAQPTMQVPASPTPDGHSITSMMPAPAHSTPTPVMLTSRSGIDTFPYHTVPGLNWPVETSSSKSETDPPPQNGKDSDRGNPILQFVPQTLTLAPTLASSSHLNIVGYDLTPGGTVIVSGTTLSRNANGRSILVLGGDTASKTDIVNAADPANNADPPLITAASQIIGVLANTGSSGDNAGDEKGQNTISGEHNNDGNEDGGNQNEQTDPLKFTPSSAGSFKGAKRSEIFKILAVVWIGLIEIIY